jgi:hypothetical protein
MAYFDDVPRSTIIKGEFGVWLKSQNPKTLTRIIKRLRMIHRDGYYGDYHDLFDTYNGLYELTFKSPPLRIYFTVEVMVYLWAGSNDKGTGYYGQDAVLKRLPDLIGGK